VRRPTHDQLSRLYPIGRTQPHRDSLWSQHPDTLRDALAACFRRADQVIHSGSAGSRSTRQLLGESYAIAGDVERAAALWRTVDVRQGQLGLRAGWYAAIGEDVYRQRIVQAMRQLAADR